MGRQKRSVHVDEMPVELRTLKRTLPQRIRAWLSIASGRLKPKLPLRQLIGLSLGIALGLAMLVIAVASVTGHLRARYPLLAPLLYGGLGGTLVVHGVRTLRRRNQKP